MIVEITGVNPPGRRCNPAPEHGPYEDVHVAAGRFRDLAGLTPGDSLHIRWRIEVQVVHKKDELDFRGPQVDGKRGDRHIYLNWLAREPDGELRLFRRAKVMLEGIDPALVARAESSGAAVRCTVSLTNERGQPTTMRFGPADLDWS